MDSKVKQWSVVVDYLQNDPRDSIAIRLIDASLGILHNDYDRLRALNYHIQKIHDELNSASLMQPPIQEDPNAPAR
jgi:hypothetical protein